MTDEAISLDAATMLVEESGQSASREAAKTDFGTIVIVGGGCYGTYYVRQLLRGRAAGAIRWNRLLVVDRDAECAVALASPEFRGNVTIVRAEWREFFAAYLAAAVLDSATGLDAIVPSPLMPHLLYDWLLQRARERWPERAVESRPLAAAPTVPWSRAGSGNTHYVSFADWVCPVNCVEPRRCPHTRGDRDWTLPATLRAHVEQNRIAGGHLAGPVVFHCTHRAYGVGMIDTREVVAADRIVSELGEDGEAQILVGTVSHCHGALNVLGISARP